MRYLATRLNDLRKEVAGKHNRDVMPLWMAPLKLNFGRNEVVFFGHSQFKGELEYIFLMQETKTESKRKVAKTWSKRKQEFQLSFLYAMVKDNLFYRKEAKTPFAWDYKSIGS